VSSGPGSGDHGDAALRAVELLAPIAQLDVPLAPHTTYRVGGSAAVFARPRTLDDLHRIADAVRGTGLSPLVVGRGSNLLVADAGFHGIAITLADLDCAGTISVEHADDVGLGGAVALPVAARRTVAAGLTGFEWAVGVPGSIGGAVRMNAGGHGSDIATSLRRVELFDLHTGHHGDVAAGSLGLRFRGSELADHQVVVTARLGLAVGDRERSEAELDEIVRWRRSNQPGGQNAGSVFVNPVPGEVAAGQLVDAAGLRGFRLGSAHVSEKHANFIQADDSGSADDVRALIEFVRERVAETSGYVLRSEVRLVGFGDPEPVVPGVEIGNRR
jgi:UDP-N-acetylmuramate dehydrogenase